MHMNDALITMPCVEPRCGPDCRTCDGNMCLTARITPTTVKIFGATYDRGAESEARIAEACSMVDAECVDALELLLRVGAEP